MQIEKVLINNRRFCLIYDLKIIEKIARKKVQSYHAQILKRNNLRK